MTIEEAIYSRLKNFAGLSALIGPRVYPSELLPQSVTYPAITYMRISTVRISAMGADTGVARARFQISCWGRNYADSVGVANQVRAALQRWRGTEAGVVIQATFVENGFDRYDPDTDLHEVLMDFEINHVEA